MNIKEAKEMEGTEFIYKYPDGDSIRAFVKKYDPEIGLTCYSLETETARDSFKSWTADEDGTWCVVGIKFARSPVSQKKECMRALTEIKETGVLKVPTSEGFGGGVSCAFNNG